MATKPPPSTIAQVKDVFTKLGEISDKVVFGDVWERKQLSKRDRSLITVAALTALYRPDQLRGHLHRALDNGVTKDEIIEIITHLAFYAGWPNAGTAALTAKEVFKEQGMSSGRLIIAVIIALMAIVTYFSSTSENPLTGEKQRVAMSPEQEIALGYKSAPQMAAQMGGLSRTRGPGPGKAAGTRNSSARLRRQEP